MINEKAVEANKNQFLSSYHMLRKMVEVCPDDVWAQYFHEVPFWYQMYHCVFFIDFWFRHDCSLEFTPLYDTGREIPPEFEALIPKDVLVTREQMTEYLDVLEKKVEAYFDGLKDSDLGKPVMPGADNLTFADIMVSQNRHVMYNMGYLNGILRGLGLEESDWWGYNESEE